MTDKMSYWNKPAKDLSVLENIVVSVAGVVLATVIVVAAAVLGLVWLIGALLLAIGMAGLVMAAKERSLRMGLNAALFVATGAAALLLL